MSLIARRLFLAVGALFCALPVIASPDLLLKSFAVDPSGAAGASVSFSFTIINQGTGGRANFSTAEMRLSTSSVAPSASDPLLLSVFTGDLAPGDTLNSSGTTKPIPSSQAPGTYYIWMSLDVGNTAGQSTADRANDVTKAPFTVTGAAAPDLFPQSFTVPSGGSAGSYVSYSITIVNQGPISAGSSTTEIRLSTSSVAPSGSDPLLLSLPTSALATGATTTLAGTNLPIPANTSPGSYYLWVTLDASGSAGQGAINQANDHIKAIFTVTGAALPDLVTTRLTANPVSGVAGSGMTLLYSIFNQGTASANPSKYEIRLSTSSIAPSSSDPLLLSTQEDTLPAGGTLNAGSTLNIPADMSPGTKYIWLLLDVTSTAGQGPANQANDRSNVMFTVVVPSKPVASFTWSPQSPSAGQPVQFTDTSSGPPTSWAWNFGDGSNGSDKFLKNPVHTYAYPGPYFVSLIATNASGSNTSNTFTINVGNAAPPKPVASFTWSPQSPSAGQPVQFTDTSTGPPTSWSWNFGDGSIGSEKFLKNPIHIYAYPGPYFVSLIATNASGSNTSSTFTINVGNASQPTPVASFTWSPQSPSAGQPVQFTDTSTGPPTSWAWSFGDASNSTDNVLKNPIHIYPYSDTYTVSLTATNAAGSTSTTHTITVAAATSTLSITTTVLNPPTATVGVPYAAQQPVAAIGGHQPYVWSASGLPSGMEINSTSGALFGTPTVAGTFNFTVTTQDNSSPRQSTSKVLTLFCSSAQPACALNCSADVPPSGVTNTPITFTAGSSSNSCSGTTSRLWSFGDGTTGNGSSVTHAYGIAGNFNWTVATSQGDSTCVRSGNVSIGAPGSGLPTIDYFRANRDQIAVGGTSDLTWSVRNASLITFEGLGNVSGNSGTTVAPASTTTYKLLATNSVGSQAATVTVRVDSSLNVSIRADRITGSTPLAVTFTIVPSGGVPPYRYQWSFGDTSVQPTHTWTTAVTEDVSCTVTDAHGTTQKSNVLRIVPTTNNATVTLGFFDLTAPSYGYSSVCPLCRIGASADGTTKVKVRAVTSSPGTVTFSFAGTAGAGDDGALFSFDGTGIGNGTTRLAVPTTRDGGANVADVYYHVPDDFANLHASGPDARPVRTITFSAQLAGAGGTSATGNMDFYLRHAPVVFVHGIWSHGSTWDAFGLTHDPDLLYRNEVVIAEWDGVSSIQTATAQVRVYLNLALQQMRMQGIAASSVDVVAHSMGGLIAKQIAHDAPELVHKLITLDTPHFGSALADFVVETQYDLVMAKAFIADHPIESGAVHDLQVDIGANARRVNTGHLRAHSIVGVASDDEPCEVTNSNQLPKLVSALCYEHLPFSYGFLTVGDCSGGLLTQILNSRVNDEIVDVVSQRGGLTNAVSEFSSGASGQHRCTAAHTNMTSDLSHGVSTRVKELLDTNRGSAAFEEYSLPSATAVGPNAEREATTPFPVMTPRPTAADTISIVAPLDGQVVVPGSAIDVVVTAPSDFTNAFAVTPDQLSPAAPQPFRARIDIPVDAIGRYPIGVRADTAAGESATVSLALNVVPNAAVTSIIVNPLELFLSVGDTVKPFVRGVFADGVIRDLSQSSGVALASSNASIVTALPDGSLKALNPGSAHVTVFCGVASAEILVNVQTVAKRRAVTH